MVLGLAGVGIDTILEEYAYTDRAVDLEALSARYEMHRAPGAGAAVQQLDPEVRGAFSRADPSNLRAAIDAVIIRYGSIEGYVKTALGMSEEEIGIVPYQLLED